jgi:NitT/TauT family transport system permease protein
LERAFVPIAIAFQAIPTIAIAPLLIIWLGPGLPTILAVSMTISFFPMLSNTLIGLHSVDPAARSLFRLYGASRWQLMRKLRIPGSMPYFLAGVRISGGLSLKGAVIGEFVAGSGGGEGGLGHVVAVASRNLQTPLLFTAALAGSTLGIIYYFAGRILTERILSWQASSVSEPGANRVRVRPAGAVGGAS